MKLEIKRKGRAHGQVLEEGGIKVSKVGSVRRIWGTKGANCSIEANAWPTSSTVNFVL